MFVGLDESGIKLRTWWKAARGSAGFTQTNAVVLGADAAESEMREPGDLLYSRELGLTFTVAGILERSGMSDDSLFFIPLRTAQAIFNSTNQLTAVAIRLKDPEELMPTAARLQNIPGAQVVTQTEMMGTFLNILGTVRTLLRSIGAVALCASIVGLMNVLFISVAERSYEFSLFRALGASRWQIFRVVLLEATLLTGAGIALGIVAALAFVPAIRVVAQRHLAFDPTWGLAVGQSVLAETLVLGFVVAGVASVLPAWRASRMQPAQALKGAD